MGTYRPKVVRQLFKLIYLGLFATISFISVSFTYASTVLVHGDSLSAGYGMLPEETWVHLLAEKIAPTPVINSSISGETSKGGLDRLPQLLQTHQPTVLVLELGANDGLRGYPIEQMEENLRQMIELGQAANAKVVLLGIRLPPNFGKRYTEPFFETYATLAKDYGLLYLPFLLEGVAQYSDLMQVDGLHPTKEAQPIILKNVLSIAAEALPTQD